MSDRAIFRSGTWRIEIAIPRDLAEAVQQTGPILLLPDLAHAIDELEGEVGEIVNCCRANDCSWAQSGETLSISKRAALECFSGEG